MKATDSTGKLVPLGDCFLQIPGFSNRIDFNVLPSITENKSASYSDEPVIGRSDEMKTYGYSTGRKLSVTIRLLSEDESREQINLNILRAIESCTYPRTESQQPYAPPPVCQFSCGRQFGESPLCVVINDYSVQYPNDIPWNNILPTLLEVSLSLSVVYATSNLPGQERILRVGV